MQFKILDLRRIIFEYMRRDTTFQMTIESEDFMFLCHQLRNAMIWIQREIVTNTCVNCGQQGVTLINADLIWLHLGNVAIKKNHMCE